MTRKPQQSRSKATVEAIIEAGIRAVASHGASATTRQIAETAGISIGSLYEYFSNKEAVFDAMHQRFINEVVALIQDTTPAIVQMPADDGVRELLRRFGALLTRDDERYLRVARQLVHNDSLNYAEPIRQMLMQLVMAYVVSQPAQASRVDLQAMAYIMINTGIFMMLHHLSTPNPPITFEQLCDGLADIVRRYLETPEPPTVPGAAG